MPLEFKKDQRFGRLVLSGQWESKIGGRCWWCICDCGSKRLVRGAHLKAGRVVSCGCHKNEQTGLRAFKHGGAKGLKVSKTYCSWRAMKNRCLNPNFRSFKWYGALGVKVCERWMKFENFLADMGERPKGHLIERRNPFGNYEPKNCLWIHKSLQSKNTRKSAMLLMS